MYTGGWVCTSEHWAVSVGLCSGVHRGTGVPCHAMPCCATTLCHAILCHVLLCQVTLCHAKSHHPIPRHSFEMVFLVPAQMGSHCQEECLGAWDLEEEST